MAGAVVSEGGVAVATGGMADGGAAVGGSVCTVGGTPAVPGVVEGGGARGLTEAGGEADSGGVADAGGDAEGLLVEGDTARGGERSTGEGGTLPGARHTEALVVLPLSIA